MPRKAKGKQNVPDKGKEGNEQRKDTTPSRDPTTSLSEAKQLLRSPSRIAKLFGSPKRSDTQNGIDENGGSPTKGRASKELPEEVEESKQAKKPNFESRLKGSDSASKSISKALTNKTSHSASSNARKPIKAVRGPSSRSPRYFKIENIPEDGSADLPVKWPGPYPRIEAYDNVEFRNFRNQKLRLLSTLGLMSVLYHKIEPGKILVRTDVHNSTKFRHERVEDDWHITISVQPLGHEDRVTFHTIHAYTVGPATSDLTYATIKTGIPFDTRTDAGPLIWSPTESRLRLSGSELPDFDVIREQMIRNATEQRRRRELEKDKKES